MSWGQGIGLGISALGAGAGIASGIEGKDARKREERLLRDLSSGQQAQSAALLEMTAPLRLGVTDTLSSVLGGGRPENFRVFGPEIDAVDAQYGRARENILGTVPARGGQMNKLLADVDIARAGAISGLETDVRKRGFDLASQIGFGTPATAFAGSNSALSSTASLANMASQREMAAGQSVGSMAGIATILSMKQPRS